MDSSHQRQKDPLLQKVDRCSVIHQSIRSFSCLSCIMLELIPTVIGWKGTPWTGTGVWKLLLMIMEPHRSRLQRLISYFQSVSLSMFGKLEKLDQKCKSILPLRSDLLLWDTWLIQAMNFYMFHVDVSHQVKLIFHQCLCMCVCIKASLIVFVPARSVAQLRQETKGSVSRNVHLCLDPKTQHGLLLEGVKMNLRIEKNPASHVEWERQKHPFKQRTADTLSFSELRRQQFLAANIFRADTLL